jgi:DNA adenine methylase
MSNTSEQALASVAGNAAQVRARVLAEIKSHPGGLTCDAVESNLDMRHQTASARVNELMTDGSIIDSGLQRPTRSGANAIVWLAVLSSPLKWVGGKRTLLPRLLELYAPHRHRRLVEPFVGGMNVALGLQPEHALLADANVHLINFYRRLRYTYAFALHMENYEHLFYKYREAFNSIIKFPGGSDTETAAELFYYLNRTCFNGLCRFNNDGKFNVPFGKYKTINYRRDFSEYAPLLQRWALRNKSFDELLFDVIGDDFIYADPPYEGTFTDYSEGGFTWEDQHRLATKLSVHPGPVVASNAGTPPILDLYKGLGFKVETIESKRSIAANGDRANALEMLATKNL